MSMRAANVLLAAGLIGLAVFGLVQAREFSDQGAQLPRLLCGVLIALGVVLLATALHPRSGAGQARVFPFGDVPWRLWWGVVVATVLLGLAADGVGFYESAFVFLAVATCMMSAGEGNWRRRWLTPVLFAAGFDAMLYVVFRLILEIPTPPGALL
jgi:hypothetical protein